MFKLMITVTVFLPLLLETECLFAGESCVAEGEPGTCLPLPQCQHLEDEVRRAVKPLLPHMSMKLQKLTCGYEHENPMVCCICSGDTASEKPAPFNDILEPDTDDNVEVTLDNRNRPIGVEDHPNLGLLPRQCGEIEKDRIFGGNKTDRFEMPWMVVLSYANRDSNTSFHCGGTLINEWYVLTAAHCVTYLGSQRLQEVILGEYDFTQDPDCDDEEFPECARKENVPIAEIVPHSGYTLQSRDDDIGLIRLARPANFSLSSMKPLCLPITQKLQTESLVGNNTNVAGWGLMEGRIQSPVLLSVELPVISAEDCMAAYRGSLSVSQTQLCAGGVKGKATCGGDSGGPLMFPGSYENLGARYVQRGIVSFGPRTCGGGGFPEVFTNVAYYMKWILDNMHS